MAHSRYLRTVLCAATSLCPAMALIAGASLPTGGTSLLQQASNGSYVNSRIRVTIDFDDMIQLNYIGMLNVASTALATLALAEITGFEKEIQFGSRNAILDVVPTAPRSEYPIEAAILCIYYGTENVMRRQRWSKVTFGCYWDNFEVAMVTIEHGSRAARNLKVLGNTFAMDATNATRLQLNGVKTSFHYTPGGKILPIPLFYITVMNAIVEFAYFGKTDVLLNRCFTDPGPQWDTSMIFSGTTSAHTEPPLLQYQWIIDTLLRLLRYMLLRGQFAEISMDFEVENVMVGNAILKAGKPPRFALLNLCKAENDVTSYG